MPSNPKPPVDVWRALLLAGACFEAYLCVESQGGRAPNPPAGYEILAEVRKREGSADSALTAVIFRSDREVIVTFCGAQPARTPDVVPELAEFLKLNQSSAAWAGKGVLCHAGFLNEYNAVRERILDALAIISPKKPIWVVGHSLGAALATICGLDLATNSHFAHLNLVTFGSPRVGNQKFAEAFNRRAAYSARFANPYDYVTREPQRNPGEAFVKKGSVYCHVKGLISLPFGRADTGRAHSLEGYRAALARMNPRVAVDFTIMNPVHCPPENGDHGLPRVAAAAKPAVDQPPEAPPEQRQRRLPPFPFGPLFRRRA